MSNARIGENDGPRLLVLDAFRALAIISVMLHHYLTRYAPPSHVPSLYGYRFTYSRWFDLGTLGVQFFFMISGFVIFMTLERCRHLIEFLTRRWARLYPAYLVSILLTFTIVNAIGPPELHRKPLDILASVLLVTPYLPGTNWVDGSYWSLLPEVQFYLIIGCFYAWCRDRLVVVWTAYALIGSLLWWLGASGALHPARTLARQVFLVESVPYFTAGLAFYLLYTGRKRGLLPLTLGALVSYGVTAQPLSTFEPIITLGMVCLFTLFVYHRLEWVAVRPLVFLGGISYSFYLLHQSIGVSLIGIFVRTLHMPDLLGCLSAAAACAVLAYAVWRIVEIPAKAALLAWARRRLFPTVHSRFAFAG